MNGGNGRGRVCLICNETIAKSDQECIEIKTMGGQTVFLKRNLLRDLLKDAGVPLNRQMSDITQAVEEALGQAKKMNPMVLLKVKRVANALGITVI